MYNFEPIAIVGLGAVLPECFSYTQVWDATFHGRVMLSDLAKIEPDLYQRYLHNNPGKYVDEKSWTLQGGFIRNFESFFNPQNFPGDSAYLSELDAIYQWSLTAANEALSCLTHKHDKLKERAGVIIGNTAMPTQLFSEYAAPIIFKELFDRPIEQKINPLNRFAAGTMATVVANALELKGQSFSMDAACASGVYSIKLACDYLHNREADLMLAGSVNAVARPMLHVAFSVLGALSLSGQSRPFHRNADGILPSEGASFVALKRLKDAIRDDDKIFGVIRGIGLSNAGREGNFIAPSATAEASCIRKAYEQADIDPIDIPYIECHATGTVIGDSVEVKAIKTIFGPSHPLVLSSLKSNYGHMMSNAGIASVVRTLGCLNNDYFPMTPNTDTLNSEFDLTSYRVLQERSPWRGNKIAGINSFGLGGSNGHMIVELFDKSILNKKTKFNKVKNEAVAVVALGVKTSFSKDNEDFSNIIFSSERLQSDSNNHSIKNIKINPKKAFVPPIDLKHTQGQQLLLLPVLEEALAQISTFDKEDTGVYMGMGIDPESARFLINMRVDFFINKLLPKAVNVDIENIKERLSPPLDGSNTTGILSHLVANRLSHVLDSKGPSFTVSCEELSGDVALKSAIAALQKDEITTAIVGAVDLSDEMVHKAACAHIDSLQQRVHADGAIVLILKKLATAERDGDRVIATIKSCEEKNYTVDKRLLLTERGSILGQPHAATGLLNLASEIYYECSHVHRNYEKSMLEDNDKNINVIKNTNFMKQAQYWQISCDEKNTTSPSCFNDMYVFYFSGHDKFSLINNIKNDIIDSIGSFRLAFVSERHMYRDKKEQAISLLNKLKDSDQWSHNNIVFNAKPKDGKLAFVFTGSASAYSGAAKDIVQYFPVLIERCKRKGTILSTIPDYAINKLERDLQSFEQTIITNILSQAHFTFLSDIIKLTPDAAIGLSQGETEALFAFGVWEDAPKLATDIIDVNLYGDGLSGQFNLANEFWGKDITDKVDWTNYFLSASIEKIREFVSDKNDIYILIIYTNSQCVIGGNRKTCEELLKKIDIYSYTEFSYNLIFHCPISSLFKDNLRKLYYRDVVKKPSIDFYSNYFGQSYILDANNIANAIVGQATSTVNFPRTVEKAWDDGIRYFIELGPKSSLASSISHILKNKSHTSMSLDIENKNSYMQMIFAVAHLWTLGFEVDLSEISISSDMLNNIIFTPELMTINARLPDITPIQKELASVVENISLPPEGGSELHLKAIHDNLVSIQNEYIENQRSALQLFHQIHLKIIDLVK